jgi:hypothetical protein
MLTLPLAGGCGCGRLRYAVKRQPLLVTLCHCTTCQKRTGSAFSMNLLVLRRDFAIETGTSITRDLKTGSGSINRHHFCEECLVRTHTEPVRHPHLTFVRPGTLDVTRDINPIAQIWTRSAQPWSIQGGIKCYDENIEDASALVARWRQENPVKMPG